jgi:hypothetical protein
MYGAIAAHGSLAGISLSSNITVIFYINMLLGSHFAIFLQNGAPCH